MPFKSTNPYTPDKPRPCDWIKRMFSLRKQDNGYLRINTGTHRNEFLHRAVFKCVAGRNVRPGFEIHHQHSDKECCCPQNLIEMPLEFNRHMIQQHPYTGRFIDKTEAMKIMQELSGVPF